MTEVVRVHIDAPAPLTACQRQQLVDAAVRVLERRRCARVAASATDRMLRAKGEQLTQKGIR